MPTDLSNGVKVWCSSCPKCYSILALTPVVWCQLRELSGSCNKLAVTLCCQLSILGSYESGLICRLTLAPLFLNKCYILCMFYALHLCVWLSQKVMKGLAHALCIYNVQLVSMQHTCHLCCVSGWVPMTSPGGQPAVATSRWSNNADMGQRLPRQLRHCQHCASGSIGDEFHMIFECVFDNQVRSQFPRLFEQFQTAWPQGPCQLASLYHYSRSPYGTFYGSG